MLTNNTTIIIIVYIRIVISSALPSPDIIVTKPPIINIGAAILTTANTNLFKKEYMLIIVESLKGIIFSKKRISFII